MIVALTIMLIIVIVLLALLVLKRPSTEKVVVVDQPYWRYSHPYWYGGYGGRGYGRRCPYGLCRY